MQYDYSKLDGLVKEKFGARYKFAEAIGISEKSMSDKFNNKVGWKQSEIIKGCQLMKIPRENIHVYFFNLKVQD